MRRLILICAPALVAFALHANAASASPGIQYGIQDDAWLLGGSGSLQRRLDFVQNLGVTTVRFSIHWDQIAPRLPRPPHRKRKSAVSPSAECACGA
jgi:hypothetical protein